MAIAPYAWNLREMRAESTVLWCLRQGCGWANVMREQVVSKLTSLSNNRGFTLLEVLIAMVIMLVGMLGLLQAIILATESNAKNMLRDEAVLVSDSWMGLLKARPFDFISTTYAPMN